MINYYEKVDFEKTVYTVGESGIEEHELGDIATQYADMATTPHGIAPRMYVEGTDLRTWGTGGSNEALVNQFKTSEQAQHALLLCHLYDLDNNVDAPLVFFSREDAEAVHAELLEDV